MSSSLGGRPWRRGSEAYQTHNTTTIIIITAGKGLRRPWCRAEEAVLNLPATINGHRRGRKCLVGTFKHELITLPNALYEAILISPLANVVCVLPGTSAHFNRTTITIVPFFTPTSFWATAFSCPPLDYLTG